MATLSDTAIRAGETVRIAIQVENTGGQVGTFQVPLVVDGERVSTQSITVAAGESETRVIDRQFTEPGTYEITINGISLGSLTVTARDAAEVATVQADRDRPDAGPIEVVNATVPADWVKQGYRTQVRVTVVNTGLQPAQRLLTVTVDDRPVATAVVRLRPTERDVVTIGFDAVAGTVAVEGVDAGRIDVNETRGGTGEDSAADRWWAGLMPGVSLTVLVLVLGTLLATARGETGN